MGDSDFPTAEPVRPQLWNPNAAANWSLLLSPAFGAYLHAANWRALGNPKRATANMGWVWVTIFVSLATGLGMLKVDADVNRMIGLGLLIGWYYTQGRSQARYVKDSLGNHYVKKGWGLPLLTGVAAVAAYFAVIFVAFASYTPDPDELAAEVKPLILREWQKKPELRGVSIQNVTLVHKEGKVYTGFVDAILGGQSERLSLEVVYGPSTIAWKVKRPAGK